MWFLTEIEYTDGRKARFVAGAALTFEYERAFKSTPVGDTYGGWCTGYYRETENTLTKTVWEDPDEVSWGGTSEVHSIVTVTRRYDQEGVTVPRETAGETQ